MADEIQVLVSLSISKNNLSASGSASLTATLSGSAYQSLVQDIGTGATETISMIGDIGTGGFVMLKNMDTGETSDITNYSRKYIDVWLVSSVTLDQPRIARLLPGEAIMLKPETAMCAMANSNTYSTNTSDTVSNTFSSWSGGQLGVVISEP